MKTISKEGFFSLWKGFTPYFARLGPHTVLTFIFLEQMNKFYIKYVLKDSRAIGGLWGLGNLGLFLGKLIYFISPAWIEEKVMSYFVILIGLFILNN